jgi:hypothetical protein
MADARHRPREKAEGTRESDADPALRWCAPTNARRRRGPDARFSARWGGGRRTNRRDRRTLLSCPHSAPECRPHLTRAPRAMTAIARFVSYRSSRRPPTRCRCDPRRSLRRCQNRRASQVRSKNGAGRCEPAPGDRLSMFRVSDPCFVSVTVFRSKPSITTVRDDVCAAAPGVAHGNFQRRRATPSTALDHDPGRRGCGVAFSRCPPG